MSSDKYRRMSIVAV